MVLLTAIGLASKELFDYNRENFKFDQEQRLERDMQRVEMQIKRFDLFREDIEDLVNLTVRKMDMYHLVASVFLGFGAIIYTEGRYEFETPKPGFFLKVYFLSVNAAIMFFLLSVWLSMYASISAHSFGVRIRTRYVRLPIPSLSQITGLTAKLTDFERQGLDKVMRVPFLQGSSSWQHRPEAPTSGAAPSNASRPVADVGGIPGAEYGFTDQASLWKAAEDKEKELGKHIQKYRQLQTNWQTYDAYARVSMSLGVNQLTKAVNYFVISVTLIQNYMTSTATAASIVFLACILSISFLDVANLPNRYIFGLQLVGALPITITVIMLAWAWKPEPVEEESEGIVYYKLDSDCFSFKFAPLVFLFEAIWLQLLMLVAQPVGERGIPYNIRAVLFLDVFGDAEYDPTVNEHERVFSLRSSNGEAATSTSDKVQDELAATAFHSLHSAWAALRRWEMVPAGEMGAKQIQRRGQLRADFDFVHRRLKGHYAKRMHGRKHPLHLTMADDDDMRGWRELSRQEQKDDEFASTLLGPLADPPSDLRHYDLEGHRPLSGRATRNVLTLETVDELIRKAEGVIQNLIDFAASQGGSRRGGDGRGADAPGSAASDSDDEASPAATGSGCCSRCRRWQGKQPKHMLPWTVLSRLTLILQLCWVSLALLEFMKDFGLVPEYLHHTSTHRSDWLSRRLGSDGEASEVGGGGRLELEAVAVRWPHGDFFRPAALSCVRWAAEGAPGLVVASPFMSYRASLPEASAAPLELEPLPRAAVPPGAVQLCAAGAGRGRCLLGRLAGQGVAVWSEGGAAEAVTLPIEAGPWTMLSGAVVPCDRAPGLAAPAPAAGPRPWCLLLVGFDGARAPLAAVPLPGGPRSLPSGAGAVRPRLAAPLALSSGACGGLPAALHVAPESGRLWALLGNGEVQSVDLLDAEPRLQRWSLGWPGPGGGPLEEPAGICEDAGGGALLLAGTGAGGPRLLRARLPGGAAPPPPRSEA